MAVFYFDSSAVAKRYLLETGTDWIRELRIQATVTTVIWLRSTE